MTNRVFVVADTHFGHKNILNFEKEYRPFSSIEEHDEALVDRWNSAVRPKDTVWHLGDVLFGFHNFPTLARLNGIKRLVMGNHDRYPAVKYLEYFNSLHGAASRSGYLLTHIPVNPNQFRRYKGNIHGHLHHNKLEDPRYVCVSVEHNNLAPVLLDRIIEGS
jgi:calcineurin-like phosphoesterase family protein